MGIVVRDIDYSRDAMERGHTRLFRDLILYAWRIAMPPSVCDVKQLGECRAELRNIEDELIQNIVQRCGMELTEIIERIERKRIFAKSFFAKAQELHRRKKVSNSSNSSSCPETSSISLALSSGDISKEDLAWYWPSSSTNSFSVIYSNTDGNFTSKEMFWNGNWYCLH